MNGKKAKRIRKYLGIDVRSEHKQRRETRPMKVDGVITHALVVPWKNMTMSMYRQFKRYS